MSIESKAILLVADLFNLSSIIAKGYKNPKRDRDNFNRNRFNSSFLIDEYFLDGYQILNIKKKDSTNKHIIFFHGGAYVNEASILHRRLIKYMINRYNYNISFIDYPLATENNWERTMDISYRSYMEIVNKNKGDDFILFGNSSGGGIALCLLSILRDNHIDIFPKKTILACPWLDLSLTNNYIKDYIDKDNILSLKGLRMTGRSYAGQLNTKDRRVSPIYGDLNTLGDIMVWTASHEIFNPDCKRLKELEKDYKDVNISLYELEDTFHDFILAPIRERKIILDKMYKFINKENI